MVENAGRARAPVPPTQKKSRSRAAAQAAFLVAVSLAIGLLIAEGLIRWLAPQSLAVPLYEYSKGIAVNRSNADGSASVPGLFSVAYRTNAQRFRGTAEYSPVPAPGVLRIAAIGDSLTFGLGAQDHEAYPAVLQRLLGRTGRVEVINAGVPGTGTGNHALIYGEFVARYRPHVVLLGVYANDVADELSAPMFRASPNGSLAPVPLAERQQRVRDIERARGAVNAIPGYAFLAQHSHLLAVVRRAATTLLADDPAPRSDGANRAQLRQRFQSEGLPLVTGAVRTLGRSIANSGAELVIVVLPARETLYGDAGQAADEVRWQADRIRIALAAVAAQERLTLLDLTEPMKRRASSGQDLYYRGADFHPRPSGYAAIAAELAHHLQDRLHRIARAPR